MDKKQDEEYEYAKGIVVRQIDIIRDGVFTEEWIEYLKSLEESEPDDA